MSNQYRELKELTVVFLNELQSDYKLTPLEYERLFKRMTENDLMHVQMFKIFSNYLEEEVIALRSNKTARYKKFVDNLIRGDM